MFEQKKLICFDLDGTLIDSVGVWNQVDAALIEQLSAKKVDLFQIQAERDQSLKHYKAYADPYLQYCAYLKEKYEMLLSPEQIKQQRYEISHYFLDQVIDLKPTVAEFLYALKQQGFILALTTTTSINNVNRYRKNNVKINQKMNIDELFSLVLTREDVENIKPHPEMYLKAMQHFELNRSECLIFEDSLIGVEAAVNAGIDVVAVYDQYSQHELEQIKQKAQFYVEDYAQLLSDF